MPSGFLSGDNWDTRSGGGYGSRGLMEPLAPALCSHEIDEGANAYCDGLSPKVCDRVGFVRGSFVFHMMCRFMSRGRLVASCHSKNSLEILLFSKTLNTNDTTFGRSISSERKIENCHVLFCVYSVASWKWMTDLTKTEITSADMSCIGNKLLELYQIKTRRS